jgi:hypothetical protein
MRREYCSGEVRPCEGKMIEMILKRPCRRPLWRGGPLALTKRLPPMRVLTDPKKLALLKAEAARREKIADRNCKTGRRRPTSKNLHEALRRTKISPSK